MSDHIGFHGGEYRGPVIGKLVEYRQRAPAPTALDALPRRAVGFTGRDGELARLRAALNPAAAGEPQAVLVTAVSGLGGIGKTALAVEAAYAAREEGWFPGGVLFVDLHGYDDAPVTADQALESLLRALGIKPGHIPVTADERAGLYRSLLAQRDAMLILTDNASSPEQVRPLLPGVDRHRVLVTSRHRLPQLGAQLVPLEQLTPRAAYQLLERALRIAVPDDSRVVDDPQGAARLAELCGHLPLSLQIGAALLAEDAGQSVADLVDELGTSPDRLDSLDDGDRSVRVTFDLSYRRLPDEQARLLRLLALAPGPEVSEEVAAALVGAEVPPLRGLKDLARAHLVERGTGRGRWRMHDLVRAFGVGLIAGDADAREEGEAARERVLEFYRRCADATDRRLRWLPGTPEPERFTDRVQALAWLDGERAGLVGAALWAREERYANKALSLAHSLAVYLDWRRYFDDLISVMRAAQEVAHRSGHRQREAVAWNNLSNALKAVGRVEEAVEGYGMACDLLQAIGDRHGEAMAWNNRGLALRLAGRVGEAIAAHVHARDMFQDMGHQHNEAAAWNNLGNAFGEAGRDTEAIDAHTRARDLLQAIGDRHREAMTWNNLGLAVMSVGRVEEAIGYYGKALQMYQEFEDWYDTGSTLANLARAHVLTYRFADGRAYWLRAAEAFTHANAPDRAAQARAQAATLTAPEKPTDKPTPASPPAHKPAPAQPSPPPPGAPDTAEQ
ncbi:tetratricopeptide repeat protein [Streptomyces diastatochromogenes]|uniref:tetratricopeptide repeat protein n=1 Tax=Streptomyces diastatochromogenes TaxID=42236 RepID=UPI00367A8B67